MAIDFPNSPTTGQIFTVGDKSWIWDGTVWKAYGASLSPTVLKVDSTNSRVGINNQSPTTALDVVGRVEVRAAATQDGVALAGGIGGTSSYEVTLRPATLSADRTLTLPDATGTVALTSDPGLQLVKTQTVGSAVASVTVTDAFSSTYDNYHITWTGGTVSALALVEVYMGNAPTSSVYQGARVSSSTAGVMNSVGDANQDRWVFAGFGSTTFAMMSFDLYNPFASRRTGIYSKYFEFGASNAFGTYVGILDNNTSYSSFTLDGQGGVTLTGGTIRIYGYRNS